MQEITELKTPAAQPSESAGAERERWENWKKNAKAWWKTAREWSRIHGRRAAHRLHNVVAGNRATGPISFLAGSAAVGVAMTLLALYSPSYAVTVNGETVGVVADASVVDEAIANVESTGSSILGYDYHVQGNLEYEFTISLRSDLSSGQDIQNYFYTQLDDLSGELRKYQVVVDGKAVGVVKDQDALNDLLQSFKDQYTTENTTSVEFLNTVEIKPVYAVDCILTIDEMEQALRANSNGSTTYTVVEGDTFYGIAYANDMSLSDLMALNPQANLDRLMVGDVLNVKELTPVLSVQTVEDVTYTKAIECPVETREDPTMYKGNSKIITQGVEGESQVNATVTYVNGQETNRVVNSTTVLREATTTVKAVGTKEKPKTASTGSFQWPISGRITSYFGGRYIFGSYSYHSGLDISTSYGAAIRAADGGTVTYAGYKGSYGNLVIITHDNGTQTYYAHNSSLLVSVGDKVYKGQQIAKAGSTGRSTGVHCHFEVRVNGTAVNPLSYLP